VRENRFDRNAYSHHTASKLVRGFSRHLARISDGLTARVFAILNELAIEAIRAGTERITDEDIESWKPALEKETMFA
jgi:hypothetical protein